MFPCCCPRNPPTSSGSSKSSVSGFHSTTVQSSGSDSTSPTTGATAISHSPSRGSPSNVTLSESEDPSRCQVSVPCSRR